MYAFIAMFLMIHFPQTDALCTQMRTHKVGSKIITALLDKYATALSLFLSY